jgi:DNA-binding NarL/FixJ family response regulator
MYSDPAPDLAVRPRVLIADDDSVVRSSLNLQLGRAFDVVGAARDAAEAIVLAAELQPDVAVVDVEMPGGGGVHAARGIAACSPSTVVMALSVDESREVVLEMLNAGAVTYVRKGADSHRLVATVMRCLEVPRAPAA